MVNRTIHHALVGLGVLGFMLQCMVGGWNGAVLCIGCDDGGVSIASPCQSQPTSCCENDEQPAETPRHGHTAANDCGCIDIDLVGVTLVVVADARLHTDGDLALPLTAWCVVAAPDVPPDVTARAVGPPRVPPRSLSPSSRCTVLLI